MSKVCATCGHEHRTMASVWRESEGTRWYCHENDHSCYTNRNQVPAEWGALLFFHD